MNDSLVGETTIQELPNKKNSTAPSSSHFFQVEQLTFLWILLILIVIGNATVLLALAVSKGRKSRMNFFIRHLAITDLCVGLISVMTDIVWKITISWEAGLLACKLIRFSQAVVTYASTYVLVALSIDRYDAITHPMNFSGSWRRAKVLIILAWALSIIFSAPILHFYTTKETQDYGTQCWIDFDQKWHWKLYMTLVSVSLFVIPAFIIAGCYFIIVRTIWKKSKEVITSASSLYKRQDRHKSDGGVESETRRASSRGLIPKAKVKTIKMTFVIIFVFILCWSPYIVFDMLQVYGCIPDSPTNRAIATFIQSLAPLNSAANPIIYCLFSANMGSCIQTLMGRKDQSHSKSYNTTSMLKEGKRPAAGKNNSLSSWTGLTTTTTTEIAK
uniref:Cardioacceleratory peptide receptor 2 [Tribolium castaneum] n=1 Tax=Lepeophtheirus salmonis TaxID=72036 RepID=A0A0K2V4B7_LEPSM